MGLPVLILGVRGSGKRYYMKEVNQDEVEIFAVKKVLLV